MNKWTPGPWKAGTFAEMECDISADGWMGLAVVNSNEDDGLAEQAKANASLIAAAPELADWLDEMLVALEASGGFKDDDELFERGTALYKRIKGEQ